MLKIVSENFIHALLLFLGLFLKISLWVPLKVFIHLIVSFDKLAFSNKLKYVKSPISKMCNDKYRVQFRLLRRGEMRRQVYLHLKNLSSPKKATYGYCCRFLKLK